MCLTLNSPISMMRLSCMYHYATSELMSICPRDYVIKRISRASHAAAFSTSHPTTAVTAAPNAQRCASPREALVASCTCPVSTVKQR